MEPPSRLSWTFLLAVPAYALVFILPPILGGTGVRCYSTSDDDSFRSRRNQTTCEFRPVSALLWLWLISIAIVVIVRSQHWLSCCLPGHGSRQAQASSMLPGTQQGRRLRLCACIATFPIIFLGSFLGGFLSGTGAAPVVGATFLGFLVSGLCMALWANIGLFISCCPIWPCDPTAAAEAMEEHAVRRPPNNVQPPLQGLQVVVQADQSAAAPYSVPAKIAASDVQCVRCGHGNADTDRFCSNCRTEIPQPWQCQSCAFQVQSTGSMNFCPQCGSADAQRTMPPQAQAVRPGLEAPPAYDAL